MAIQLDEILGRGPYLIGMIHLLPLPGAPAWNGKMDAVLERAVADARALERAGFDAVLVENYNDLPFYPDRAPPETVAAMAVCAREAVRASRLPVGVNVLRNDATAALSVACAAGARFIRVNVHTGVMLADQGFLEGHAHETLRLRRALGSEIAIFADVHVKHAMALPGADLAQDARDAFHRGMADALIASGAATGAATDLEQVRALKAAVPEAPVLIGSGVTAETLRAALNVADGVIVGSAAARDGIAGLGIDPERAAAFGAARLRV